MARGRRGTAITAGRAAVTAGAWGVGVAIGVALGGYLTVTSGSGAPGTAALDTGRDLILVPLLSGLVVFVCVFLGLMLVALVLRSRSSSQVDDA